MESYSKHSNSQITCSFCKNNSLTLVLDLGTVALAGGFLLADSFARERRFPLRLFFCEDCYACQVVDKVDENILFSNYFYFSSSIQTLKDHFKIFADEMAERFLKGSNSSVLEFGCNDGVLLIPFAEKGIQNVIGVDPATNVIGSIDDDRIELINSFFGKDVAGRVKSKYGNIDLIVANNVFAHIADINEATESVRNLLKPEGVFVFEVHYLANMIDEVQYDMIYHEHLYYHSFSSLKNHFCRFGMTIFDVKRVPTHAGSMRFYVASSKSSHAKCVSSSVIAIEKEELSKGFNSISIFDQFRSDVEEQRDQLLSVLKAIKNEGKTIAGYGASGRASTMMQYCGIGSNFLEFIIDDSPRKQGFFTPGNHLRIVDNSILDTDDAPDFILLFAWSFYKEVIEKSAGFLAKGGKFIIPLPKVSIFPN